MKRKLKSMFILAIIGLFLSFIYFQFFAYGGGGGFPSGTTKTKIDCDVSVKNPLGQELEISQVSCRTSACSLFDTQSIGGLIFGSDQGKIVLTLGGAQLMEKSIKVGETDTETYSLSGCSISQIGTINLYDDKNQLIDSKEVGI